jgi:hypothetical protein
VGVAGGMLAAVILADASKSFYQPVGVLLDALVEPEAWLALKAGEVMPTATRVGTDGVSWTSLWPVAPGDVIAIQVTRDRSTTLRFQWSTGSPPDDRGIGKVRFRLNYIFGSELRGVVYGR